MGSNDHLPIDQQFQGSCEYCGRDCDECVCSLAPDLPDDWDIEGFYADLDPILGDPSWDDSEYWKNPVDFPLREEET